MSHGAEIHHESPDGATIARAGAAQQIHTSSVIITRDCHAIYIDDMIGVTSHFEGFSHLINDANCLSI